MPRLEFRLAFQADLADRETYGGASASGTSPLVLSMRAAPWSFALGLPLPERRDESTVYIAQVTGRVLEGAFAIGILDADNRTIREDRLVSAPETGTWEILLVPGEGHRLLFRVAGDAASASAIEIEAVRWLASASGCDPLFEIPASEQLTAVAGWNRYYGPHGGATERLRAYCHERLAGPREFPWLFGMRLMAYPNDQISRAVFVSGLYEPATMLALRRLVQPGHTVIDGGANVGLFSLAFSAWTGPEGRVLAFEPSSREYVRLVEHVRLNGVTNVETRPHALGRAPGRAVLRIADPHYSGLNTLGDRMAYDNVPTAATETVDVTTIDEAASACEHVHLIKLDVEGSEHDALLGARGTIERWRPAIAFEANAGALASRGRTTAELESLLIGIGYEVLAVQEDGALTPAAAAEGEPENFVALARREPRAV